MRNSSPLFEQLDEITISYWKVVRGERVQSRRQLARHVVRARNGWATIVFAFQDYKSGEGWCATRFSLQRWRRIAERWRCISKIHLQAIETVDALAVLSGWHGRDLTLSLEDDDAA